MGDKLFSKNPCLHTGFYELIQNKVIRFNNLINFGRGRNFDNQNTERTKDRHLKTDRVKKPTPKDRLVRNNDKDLIITFGVIDK